MNMKSDSADFEAIKDAVDICDEIGRVLGAEIKKIGEDTYATPKGVCPFCHHKDCFRIWKANRIFKCMSASCGKTGSIIDFHMLLNDMEPLAALEKIAEEHGIPISKPGGGCTPARSNRARILNDAADYYHQKLMNNKAALAYQTQKRGHSLEVIKKFRVGYVDGGLFKALVAKGYTPEEIQGAGLGKAKEGGGGYDHFQKGMTIYPHLDRRGNVAHMSAKDPKGKVNSYQLKHRGESGAELFLNDGAFKGDSIVLVEGQNDLLSAYDQGGCENVVAVIGSLSEKQTEHITEWATKGKATKRLYLCFDNPNPDKPGDTSGEKYTAKVFNALKDYAIPKKLEDIAHRYQASMKQPDKPEDDENETPKPPLEIPKRVELFRLRFNQEMKDIDDYLQASSEPKPAMDTLIKTAEPMLMPLKDVLSKLTTIARKAGYKNASADKIGETVFDYLDQGGKFYIDTNRGVCCLFYRETVYDVGNNLAFVSLLYTEAGLNFSKQGTSEIVTVIKALAYEKSEHIQGFFWIHTQVNVPRIFFNLCNDRNEIAILGPGGVDVAQNGTNQDRILLRRSPVMSPINYFHKTDIKEALELFKSHVMDNLPCSPANRYFLACKLINTLLIQFSPAVGITKCTGDWASGKTSAAKYSSAFIYGSKDGVSTSSPASIYTEGTQSPMIIEDNLEERDMCRTMLNALLLGATGITKRKRSSSSDTSNIYEAMCCQFMITAIDPFSVEELISRTTDIHFNVKRWANPDFVGETDVMEEIKTHRDVMWSGIFKMIAYDVLPGFKEKRRAALKKLRTDLAGHAKERVNELYACFYILCEALSKYIPDPRYQGAPPADIANELLDEWVTTQNSLAEESYAETNEALHFLELLVKEFQQDLERRNHEVITKGLFKGTYYFEPKLVAGDIEEPKQIEFTVTPRELFSAFQTLAKRRGIPCPFKNTRQLGARIKTAGDVLKKAGWRIENRISARRGETLNRHTKAF